jgi:glycosyltransferase involved in cell wall biosynthesis
MARVSPTETWIVIPAYNEAPYIERVLKKVQPFSSNVIVVDDGSHDQTSAVAQPFAAYVLTHRLNLGKGAALKTGCQFAFETLNAAAIVMLDADDQHDPAELPLFFEQLKQGRSLILGVRDFDRSMPITKRAGNQLASKVIEWLFGTFVPDIPSGYKAFTRTMYEQLVWQVSDYAVELEIAISIAKKKLQFVVVPIKTIYHDTDKGMTMLDTLAMLKQIITIKFRV